MLIQNFFYLDSHFIFILLILCVSKALLKLYQQSKDTIKEMELAKEIVQMPTKIRNKKTDQIKAYATSIIRKEHDNHINTFNK